MTKKFTMNFHENRLNLNPMYEIKAKEAKLAAI